MESRLNLRHIRRVAPDCGLGLPPLLTRTSPIPRKGKIRTQEIWKDESQSIAPGQVGQAIAGVNWETEGFPQVCLNTPFARTNGKDSNNKSIRELQPHQYHAPLSVCSRPPGPVGSYGLWCLRGQMHTHSSRRPLTARRQQTQLCPAAGGASRSAWPEAGMRSRVVDRLGHLVLPAVVPSWSSPYSSRK